MKAVIIQGPGDASVTERPKPKLRDDYVLVKVKAIAINPTDWKHLYRMSSSGALLGCDYSGVVEEVGKNVTKFKIGERIAGFVHGGNHVQHEDGAFAEYIVAKADVQIRLPDYLSFEKAATFGVASMTVGQGLYQKMGLAWPSNPSTSEETILIYGGSGGMGTYGIQFAKLSGYKVITACSPRNFGLVKALGAVEAFDYNDPDCAKKIREYTHDNLKLCWDTIGLPATAELCANALSSEGEKCRYGAILNVTCPRPEVKSTWTLAYTATGESFEFGPVGVVPASKEDFEYMKDWALEWEKVFQEKRALVPEPKVGPDGLKGVIQGMDDVKNGTNSGTRLVYRVDETP